MNETDEISDLQLWIIEYLCHQERPVCWRELRQAAIGAGFVLDGEGPVDGGPAQDP